jgi:uncharacterized membrane protein
MEKLLLLSCFFPIALTIARILYTGTPLFLFLIWNLFLALIPYLVSRFMIRSVHWVESNWRFVAGSVLWLLFIPNAFYLITDLFHLEDRSRIPLWFDLALIFSFAWNGMLLGMLSVRQMEVMVQVRYRLRYEWLFVFPVMLLNALGIYVGRYLRYNSWDVITDPRGLTEDMLWLVVHPVRNRFDWSMIMCYALMLSIVYMSMKRIRETK